jgi:hypothetical protein
MWKDGLFKEPQPGFRAGDRLHRAGTFERGMAIEGISISLGGMMPFLLHRCLC